MIVECPDCGSRYRIQDGKIPSSGGRVTCPSCDHAFVVWPGGETADMASPDAATGGSNGAQSDSGDRSRNEESTAVADAEEIRRQVEQSVADEDAGSFGESASPSSGSSESLPSGGGGPAEPPATGSHAERPSEPGQPDQQGTASEESGVEESSPQQGGIPDFLEEAMEGTEEEGTVEMENPFLDDDGSMSVPDEFNGDEAPESPGGPQSPGSPQAPGPESQTQNDPRTSTNPDPPGPDGSSGLSQGDPNATNPVPLGERSPDINAGSEQRHPQEANEQVDDRPADESEFDEATRKISGPDSIGEDDDLFGDDLFGEESGAGDESPGEGEVPRTEELSPEDVPDTRPPTPGSQEQSNQETAPAPERTPASEQSGVPNQAARQADADQGKSRGGANRAADQSPAPAGPAEKADASGGAEQSERVQQAGGAAAAQGRQSAADEQQVSRLLIVVFVLLFAIFLVLLAGALGLFDLRAALPGVEAEANEASSEGRVTATESVAPTRASVDDDIAPMVRAGVESLEANRLHDALRHFRTATMTAPESARVHRLLARTYRKLDQPDRASSHRLSAQRLEISDDPLSGRDGTPAR